MMLSMLCGLLATIRTCQCRASKNTQSNAQDCQACGAPAQEGMKLQERSSCESDVVRVALLGRIEPSPLAVSYASVRAALHQGTALGPLRRVRGVPTGSNAAVFEVAKSVLAETVFGLNTVFYRSAWTTALRLEVRERSRFPRRIRRKVLFAARACTSAQVRKTAREPDMCHRCCEKGT